MRACDHTTPIKGCPYCGHLLYNIPKPTILWLDWADIYLESLEMF
jgi:hypothetical protein